MHSHTPGTVNDDGTITGLPDAFGIPFWKYGIIWIEEAQLAKAQLFGWVVHERSDDGLSVKRGDSWPTVGYYQPTGLDTVVTPRYTPNHER